MDGLLFGTISIEVAAISLSVISALVASVSTVSEIVSKKRELKVNSHDESFTIKVNGRKIEVSGEEKKILSKVLDIDGGELIFIEDSEC